MEIVSTSPDSKAIRNFASSSGDGKSPQVVSTSPDSKAIRNLIADCDAAVGTGEVSTSPDSKAIRNLDWLIWLSLRDSVSTSPDSKAIRNGVIALRVERSAASFNFPG